MVLSIIDQTIKYSETKSIELQDINYETDLYYGEIFKKNISFVLGKPNFEHVDKNIVYFNIYLVNDSAIHSKIGIYETENDKFNSISNEFPSTW